MELETTGDKTTFDEDRMKNLLEKALVARAGGEQDDALLLVPCAHER